MSLMNRGNMIVSVTMVSDPQQYLVFILDDLSDCFLVFIYVELDIPKELDIPMEDCEEEEEGELKEEEWEETGIEQFANEAFRALPASAAPVEVPPASLPPS